jgi:hypothetical protein
LGSEGGTLHKSAFFLDSSKFAHYQYRLEALIEHEKQKVYRISFKGTPKQDFGWEDGVLYIHATTYALVGIRYHLNEKSKKREMNEALGSLRSLMRLVNGVSLSLDQKTVLVDYERLPSGRWRLGRVQQLTQFALVAKRKGVANSQLKFVAELAVFSTNELTPQPIAPANQLPRNKPLPTTEKGETYNAAFWEKYNYLLPEDDVLKMINEG